MDYNEDDDDRAPSSSTLSLSQLKSHIAKLQREAKIRAEEDAKKRALEDAEHPEPPTLDLLLKQRARVVWVKMRRAGLWHAPWHHEEIWWWAGSTPEGQEWLAKEVSHWEVWVEHFELQKRLTAIRLCEEGCSLSDGTTLRTLDQKLKRRREEPA